MKNKGLLPDKRCIQILSYKSYLCLVGFRKSWKFHSSQDKVAETEDYNSISGL